MHIFIKGGDDVKLVDVDVRGYKIYAENQRGELYDIFVPMQKYYLTKQEAQKYLNENDKLLAVKRENRSYKISYNVLLDAAQEEIIK